MLRNSQQALRFFRPLCNTFYQGRVSKFEPQELSVGLIGNPFEFHYTDDQIFNHVYPELTSDPSKQCKLVSMTSSKLTADSFAGGGGYGDITNHEKTLDKGTVTVIDGTHLLQHPVKNQVPKSDRVSLENEYVTHFVPTFFMPYFLMDGIEVTNPFAIDMKNAEQVKGALQLIEKFEYIKMQTGKLPESELSKLQKEHFNELKNFYDKNKLFNPFKSTFGKLENGKLLWNDPSILSESVGEYYWDVVRKQVFENSKSASPKASPKLSK